jgi:hypothetical protein
MKVPTSTSITGLHWHPEDGYRLLLIDNLGFLHQFQFNFEVFKNESLSEENSGLVAVLDGSKFHGFMYRPDTC